VCVKNSRDVFSHNVSDVAYVFTLNDVRGMRIATAYLVCQVAVSCVCLCQQLNSLQYLANASCMTGTCGQPFACRKTHLRLSLRPRDVISGSAAARMLGLRFRIPLGKCMSL
jgi:hypothetical protein